MSKQLYRQAMSDLEINDRDLNHELSRQSSKFCFYGSIAAKSARTHHKEKIKLKELEAHISQEFRNTMQANEPTVRVTDSMIRTFITNTEEYKEQMQAVMKAQYQEDLLMTIKEAFRQRAQLLLQLARLKAEELYAPAPTIYKKEFEERAKDKEHKVLGGILKGKKP